MVKEKSRGHLNLIYALRNAGFEIVRQKCGHVSLQNRANNSVVRLHDELAKGTLWVSSTNGD